MLTTKLSNNIMKSEKSGICILAFSIFIGLVFLLGQTINGFENLSDAVAHSLLAAIVSFFILGLSYYFVASYRHKTICKKASTLKLFPIFFLIFLVVYFLAFLTYFPGTSYNDTTMILMNGMMMGNQYPVLFCFIMVIIAKLGLLLGSIRITYTIYCFIQLLLVSAFTAWICRWIFMKPVPLAIKILTVVYFAITPLFGMYAVSVIKDTLFSISLIVFSTIYFDLMVEDENISKSQWCLLFFCIFLIYSYRNNGIYVLIPVLIVMFIKKKEYRKQVCCLFIEIAILFIICKLLSWRFDIVPLFKESIAIPLQQIAATVQSNGIISDEQLAFIDRMMPVEMIKENYDASYADPIKWSPYFDDTFVSSNKLEFFITWIGLLLNNFKTYVYAYLRETLWYWFPSNRGDVLIVNWLGGVPQEWLNTNGLTITPLLSGKLLELMYAYYESSKYIPCEGICIWIMFCSAFIRWITNKTRTIIAYFPCFLLWLTLMISAPTSSGTRYILPFMYGIPFFIAVMFCGHQKIINKTDNVNDTAQNDI